MQHVIECDVRRRHCGDVVAGKEGMARVIHFVVAAAEGVLLQGRVRIGQEENGVGFVRRNATGESRQRLNGEVSWWDN